MKCCGRNHHHKPKVASQYIGMTETDAVAAIGKAGLTSRIRSRDGQVFMGTMDMREDRVNLTIEGGKVTQASTG